MAARFICQNCGAQVNRNSKTCPQCGRPFANVLCPACGFEGEERFFSAGCPSCGYTSGGPAKAAVPKQGTFDRNRPGKGKGPESAGLTGRPPRFAAGELPAWAYALAILAFVGVLALLLK
ncbi:hypothetical protein AGMMS4952_22790 [Spirochaetia bacterium]|nr:hypothetical protein AGMMS4952_22790 [Spirochaetia bacterium]